MKRQKQISSILALCLLVVVFAACGDGGVDSSSSSNSDIAETFFGARQFGTTEDDIALGIAVDSAGNSYITGVASGSFPGYTNAGSGDAFIAKYDANGNQLWVRQFGTDQNDTAYGIAVDSAGNSYITGYTSGSFPGCESMGGSNAFIAKYDANGNQLWVRQFGTTEYDYTRGIAVDSAGNSYVTGVTSGSFPSFGNAGSYDAFIAKYDTGGNQLWVRQFGTDQNDTAYGIAVDSAGNNYVTGVTSGSFPRFGNDYAFIAKYDKDGNQLWVRQFGTTESDTAYGIAVDSAGNSYITGYTYSAFSGTSAGGSDAFIAKYDMGGNQLWVKQFGTTEDDRALGIAVDSAGNVYITGYTYGAFPGYTSAGGIDAFIAKYDSGGNQMWVEQFGTTGDDRTRGIAIDSVGSVFITGDTNGVFPGYVNEGEYDAFIAKVDSDGAFQ